jgi:hypothetical protein
VTKQVNIRVMQSVHVVFELGLVYELETLDAKSLNT